MKVDLIFLLAAMKHCSKNCESCSEDRAVILEHKDEKSHSISNIDLSRHVYSP